MTMSGVEQMLRRWRTLAVALNPPASAEQIRMLPELLGGAVPPDPHALYAAADGMPENATDGWYVSLWSIDRVTREREHEMAKLNVKLRTPRVPPPNIEKLREALSRSERKNGEPRFEASQPLHERSVVGLLIR